MTISTALNALRVQDFDRAIALARQIFSESSSSFGDHLFLGQFYLAAGRRDEAGQHLRRAVELGPGAPITWVTYVKYLVQVKQTAQAKAAVESAQGPSRPTDQIWQLPSALPCSATSPRPRRGFKRRSKRQTSI